MVGSPMLVKKSAAESDITFPDSYLRGSNLSRTGSNPSRTRSSRGTEGDSLIGFNRGSGFLLHLHDKSPNIVNWAKSQSGCSTQ
jgi:hypothetical protein